MKRYFEVKDAKSNKFWEVSLQGSEQVVRFGRIGIQGQEKKKNYGSVEEAEKETTALIAEKLAKGYQEIAGDQVAATSITPAVQPAAMQDRDLQEMVNSGELEAGPLGANFIAALAKENNIRRLSQLLKIPPANLASSGARDLQRALKEAGITWGKTLPAPKPPKNGIPKWKVTYAPAEGTERIDRIGGSPNRWGDKAQWPACSSCHKPLGFYGQILGKKLNGQADLGTFAALQMFVCITEKGERESSGHKPWNATDSGNQALFRRELETSCLTSPAAYASKKLVLEAGVDDPILEKSEKYQLSEKEEERLYEAMDEASGDKIGGCNTIEKWRASPCSRCGKPMVFFARLSSPENEESILMIETCLSCEQAAFSEII
jgi:predicted DNA-binding WGR domain protein